MKPFWMHIGLFLCACQLHAQLHDHPVIIDDVLPSTFVTDIDQDSSGYIWISTYGGLCRYDGSRIRTFIHQPGNPHSILQGHVNEALYDTGRNCLWVGTDSGLCRLDSTHTVFEWIVPNGDSSLFSRRVEALCLDPGGALWFSLFDFGLCRIAPETDRGSLYPLPIDLSGNVPSQAGYIRDVAQDRSDTNNIWIGTSGGLFHLNKSSGVMELHLFEGIDPETAVYYNQFRSVFPAKSGVLYLATWSDGLMRYDPDRSQHGNRKVSPGDFSVFGDRGFGPPLLQRNAHELWTSSQKGICAFDMNTGTFKECLKILNSAGRYFAITVELEDREGRLWASSEQGVYLFDSANALVHNYRFEPGSEGHYYLNGKLLDLEPEEGILITYERSDGLYFFDRTSETFELMEPPGFKSGSSEVFIGEDLLQRPDGQILVVERDKVFLFDPVQHSFSTFHLPLDGQQFLWRSAVEDIDGRLWFGTANSGLVRYDEETGDITIFGEEHWHPAAGWPNPIDALFVDSRGNIWVRLMYSYAVFDVAAQQIVHIPALQGQAVFTATGFAEDSHGNIWIGVPGMGVARVPHRSSSFLPDTIFGIDSGLPNLDIRAVAFDEKELLWMITPMGLQSLNPATGVVRILSAKDGVITFDPNFNRNPMVLTQLVRLSDGKMAYAPRAGLSIFDPQNLPVNREVPRVYLYNITMGDSTRHFRIGDSPGTMHFGYRVRSLILRLSSMAFSQSEYIRFEYQLDRHDSLWLEAPGGEIAFNALYPGTYTLKYRALNSNGVSSDIRAFSFEIRPPWWQQWWFIILMALSTGGALWAFVYWRWRHQRRLRQRENEIQVLLATLESRALRSQMNPHFLFNIFNTIQELILTGDNEMAYEYTSKFSRLLRMILENASKDTIPLSDEKQFLQLYLELESLRFDDAFTYDIGIEPGIEHHHIPVFMLQPLVENAIRHGLLPKHGEKRLSVDFSAQDKALTCVVRDNGIGFKHAKGNETEGRWHAIEMIKRRLEIGKTGQLVIENGDHGGVEAILTLPYT